MFHVHFTFDWFIFVFFLSFCLFLIPMLCSMLPLFSYWATLSIRSFLLIYLYFSFFINNFYIAKNISFSAFTLTHLLLPFFQFIYCFNIVLTPDSFWHLHIEQLTASLSTNHLTYAVLTHQPTIHIHSIISNHCHIH